MAARVRVAVSFACILVLTACGGGGIAPTPIAPQPGGGSAPPSSGGGSPGSVSSLPAPSSVTFTTISTPDKPMGGIGVTPDGTVYLNGAGGFMQYTGAFKQYAYPVYAGAVAGLPGLNTLAVDSSGTVWTLLLVSANAPTTGAVAQLSPQNGSIGEFLTSPPGDYFTSIASAGAQAVWAVDLTPAIRNGGNAATGVDVFVNTSSIQNGFDPEAMPVFAEGLGADGRMYVATDPSELTNVPPPSEVFRYNPMTLALIDTVALPSGSRATQFAAGPDGAIWFTDSGLNKIGRIASSGAVTYFSVLTPNSGLAGIAPGSDNAMWFTETNAGKIGRIGLSGGVNEYAIPTPNEQPMGISAGTAGGCLPQTLYFTEANGLGKLTFKT